MGRLKFLTLTLILFSATINSFSQQSAASGQNVPTQPETKYDYHGAFGPIFLYKKWE